jgi:hypothetical protein
MKRLCGIGCWLIVTVLCASPALAGEPLVQKTQDGKFVPAVANEWAKSGEHAFRFVLKTGAKASDVANELKDKMAPISVTAPDDFTLVFSEPALTEAALLDKLSGLPIGGDKAKGDAVAALAGLGGEGPALSDLSSAGSIRASKKIDLPDALPKKDDLANLTGVVVKVCECGAVPSVVIKVLKGPRRGQQARIIWGGQVLSVRGYYKIKDEASKEPDPEDPRTKVNLGAKDLKPGDKIWGKPIQKDGDEWVLETVQKF